MSLVAWPRQSILSSVDRRRGGSTRRFDGASHVEKSSITDKRGRVVDQPRRARPCAGDSILRFERAEAGIVVVTMADGVRDDPQQIDPLALLVERGVVIAAAPVIPAVHNKRVVHSSRVLLSRTAGLSLRVPARVGGHVATN